MERALVVVEASESSKDLLRQAGDIAAAMDAELVLLHVTSEVEFKKERQAMADIGSSDLSEYGVDQAASGARQFAVDVARIVLEDVDVQYETLGEVGDTADVVLSTIREKNCDHVFVAGRRRSPTGKAIFGDTAQKIILNSDIPVTVVTDE